MKIEFAYMQTSNPTHLSLIYNTFMSSVPLKIQSESILSYPCMMLHASIPQKERAVLGITENRIRLSVGLENWEDLFNDIHASAAGGKRK